MRLFCQHLSIRHSQPADLPAISAIHEDAFSGGFESRLALSLIASPVETLSLIAADEQDHAVGHILLSRIDAPLPAAALAPLAVMRRYQNLQVGTKLVRAALEEASRHDWQAVFVLGDPNYYERFGFSSPKADPFHIAWQGPAFMAIELVDRALAGKSGKLRYPEQFFSETG